MTAQIKRGGRRKNQACVLLSDTERDALYELCEETGESISTVMRKCFLIALGMNKYERQAEWVELEEK